MKIRWVISIVSIALCTPAFAETGRATLKGAAEGSPIAGTATFTDSPDGLKVSVHVEHASPGTHGLHIHEFGLCDDLGKAAGGHFNPDQVKHGFLPHDGFAAAHAGDFGNIEVAPDGSGTVELTLPGLTVTGGHYSVSGRAVVLHEHADDFGQPTGNAGGRIGCGSILVTKD